METAIEYQSNKYNTSPADSRTLDHEETILGHLLAEKNHTLQDSLTYLASYAKTETKTWEHTESVSSGGFWIGLVAGGVSFMAVGAGPIGLAVGGLIAAIGSGGSWYLKDISERVGALRRTEFELHKHHPWIREKLWELSQQGASTAQLVAVYDRMIFTMFSEGIPSDGSTIAGSMSINPNAQTIAPTPANVTAEPFAPTVDMPIAVEPIQVESTPIALGESIAVAVDTPIAVAPSYGISKVLSPLDILIKARFSHRAFYGGQRTGKSYLTAVASQELSKTGIKVFHMNLFSHGPEDSKYWGHASRSVQCDLSSLSPGEAVPFIRQAQSILSEFKQTTGALLIIDEITSLGNLRSEHLEKLQPFINGLVSYINAIRDSSKKRQKAVWTIAPGIVSAGLDQGVKELIKGLSPVLVSIPKDVSIEWEGQALTTDLNVYGQLKVNYQGISEPPSMDCDRMVLIDNVWLDMGELPKLMTASVLVSESITVPEPPIAVPSPSSETQKLSQGQVTWEWLKVGSPAYPDGTDAIDVEPIAETWQATQPIEVAPVETVEQHPLKEKFDRIESLLESEGTISVKELQTRLKISTSKEAQQLAQMFCISQKSRYKFASKSNPNGTTSYLIQAIT